jgi:hypothetical protein
MQTLVTEFVIASEAKHPVHPRGSALDCFASLAMTTSEVCFDRRTRFPLSQNPLWCPTGPVAGDVGSSIEIKGLTRD